MKDEKYAFFEEVREKKNIARGAHYRKAHAGKGGRARFRTDHMTKKELEKLNGETKTYQMNKFITYKEFKKLPPDLKKTYLTGIIEKFNIPMSALAKAWGISKYTVYNVFSGLEINTSRPSRLSWDEEKWNAFINPQPAEPIELTNHSEDAAQLPPFEENIEKETVTVANVDAPTTYSVDESLLPKKEVPVVNLPMVEQPEGREYNILGMKKIENVIPHRGHMELTGHVADVLNTIAELLKDGRFTFNVYWEQVDNEPAARD
jgi:hypothetical protein